MREEIRHKLVEEITDWRHRGLIDDELASILDKRYQDPGRFLHIILKWLSLFAILLLGGAVVALVGLMVKDDPIIFLLFLLAVTMVTWIIGKSLVIAPEQKYAFTGSILITLSLVGLFASLSGFMLTGDFASSSKNIGYIYLISITVASLAAFFTAYKYHLRWPLILALLLFFHGLGNWHSYGGHGNYFLNIKDAKLTAVLALMVIAVGWWHQNRLEEKQLSKHNGFGHIILMFGLIYLNIPLWILSLTRDDLLWVLVFTGAAIAQIVVGGILKDSRFTGFGVVFLGISMYTRFFEHFWDRMSAALFFFAAGIVAMILGFYFEKLANKNMGHNDEPG